MLADLVEQRRIELRPARKCRIAEPIVVHEHARGAPQLADPIDWYRGGGPEPRRHRRRLEQRVVDRFLGRFEHGLVAFEYGIEPAVTLVIPITSPEELVVPVSW